MLTGNPTRSPAPRRLRRDLLPSVAFAAMILVVAERLLDSQSIRSSTPSRRSLSVSSSGRSSSSPTFGDVRRRPGALIHQPPLLGDVARTSSASPFRTVAGGHRSTANRLLATALRDGRPRRLDAHPRHRRGDDESVRLWPPVPLIRDTRSDATVGYSSPVAPRTHRHCASSPESGSPSCSSSAHVPDSAPRVRRPGPVQPHDPARCRLHSPAPLVMVRLGRLVGQNEMLAALEATLRSVGERLVAAGRPEEDVVRIITVGLEQVLGATTRRRADPRPNGSATQARYRSLTPAIRALDPGSFINPRSLRTGEVRLMDTSRASGIRRMSYFNANCALLVAVSPQRDLRRRTQRPAVADRGVDRVTRAVEQTGSASGSGSEERFGSLVDNSSDIVTSWTTTDTSPTCRRSPCASSATRRTSASTTFSTWSIPMIATPQHGCSTTCASASGCPSRSGCVTSPAPTTGSRCSASTCRAIEHRRHRPHRPRDRGPQGCRAAAAAVGGPLQGAGPELERRGPGRRGQRNRPPPARRWSRPWASAPTS